LYFNETDIRYNPNHAGEPIQSPNTKAENHPHQSKYFQSIPKKKPRKPPKLKQNKKGKKINKYSGKRSVQFADFGVIARENTVTSGHASIGRDNAVISSGNCNARSAHNKYIHHKL
jgi:hypothetical protein